MKLYSFTTPPVTDTTIFRIMSRTGRYIPLARVQELAFCLISKSTDLKTFFEKALRVCMANLC